MRKMTPRLLSVAMGACLCLVPASVGQAQSYPPSGGYSPQPYCPQPNPPPWSCPPGQPLPPPQQPGTPPPPAEQPKEKPQEKPETTRPGEQPSTQRPGEQTPSPQNQPEQNQPEQNPQAPEQNAADTSANASANASTAAAPGTEGAGAAGAGGDTGAAAGEAAGAEAGLGATGTASSAGMLGRGDADNRFNLFDNMSPFLANRIWGAYQFQENFNTGVQANPTNPGVTKGFAQRRDEDLYRVGGEIIPFGGSCYGPNISLSFETQYVSSTNTEDSANAWSNPQATVKWLVSQSNCGAWALILGVQPQTASHDGELHEKSTRILPGVLFYQALTSRLFVQGGAQMGISDRNDPNTIDYALSVGYWLYGSPEGCPVGCCKPWITAVIPQVEVYGANVVANDHSDPFELQGNPAIPNSSAPYQEPRNVYDVTAGGRVLLRDSVSVGTAYSFPISGPSVRKAEFLTSLTVFF